MRFKSIFARRIAQYIRLRRALGYQLEKQGAVLRSFDDFVHRRRHRGLLTQELALAFAAGNVEISPGEVWRRYQFIRHFSEYLAAFQPRTPSMDPKALRRPSGRPVRYIYRDEEVARLLQEARRSCKRPMCGWSLEAIIGLAASTGLRVGEVVRLDKTNVDLERGILFIRNTKFKKDRLVPVHSTTATVLQQYAVSRDAAFPNCDCPAFFISLWRKRFSPHTISCAFTALARGIGLRGPKGRGPSFHGLRHRFAVRRLVQWYREGRDVQALLPALATYLGHVCYSETAYYITATAELLGLAAARYHRPWPEGRSET